MSLKNNSLFRRYKYIKGKYLPQLFVDWICRVCGIKEQTIYNCINLSKLMSVAPKLLGCRVNRTYFVKNYESLMTHFENK